MKWSVIKLKAIYITNKKENFKNAHTLRIVFYL